MKVLKNKNGNIVYSGGFLGVRYYKGRLYAPLNGHMCEVSIDEESLWGKYAPKSFTHKQFKQLQGVIKIT